MAKLAVFAAVFFALIALSTASTFTTTVVTTTEIDPQQPCQKEIQQKRMTHCMRYMQQVWMEGPYELSFLRSALANPREEHLEECCNELKSVSSECRGDAVRHMMKELKETYGIEHKMKEKARALQQKCKSQVILNYDMGDEN